MPGAVAPPESLASFRRADRLAVDSGSQRFPCPSTTSLARAPYAAYPSWVRHGSDPGVSHPLAGFLARSSLRVCFAPLPSLGSRLPSERSPRVRSRTPRRGRWLPCRSSRSNPGAACAVLSPLAFTDSGDVRASSLAGSCRRLEAPFQLRSSRPPRAPCGARSGRVSRRLPVTLDPVRRTHLGPAVPSTSKRSSLRESVHTARRSPVARRPVLSWASSPLQSLAPARPGALSPTTAGGVPPPAGLLGASLDASRGPQGSPRLRALLLACATSAPLLETLDVRWNRAWTTESSRSTRRRTPDLFDPGRATSRQQPRLP